MEKNEIVVPSSKAEYKTIELDEIAQINVDGWNPVGDIRWKVNEIINQLNILIRLHNSEASRK
jgi:hypothetical protein